MLCIQIIDSHTGGEPTRLVLDGGPDLGTGSLAARAQRFASQYDHWRSGILDEPRGGDALVGALLCEPVDAASSTGVIFFNNVGYLGMCGHGTMGVVQSLAYLGRLAPGWHQIETPVGPVHAFLHDDGSVSVRNVPAYRHLQAVTVTVEGHGPVRGDVAWGGNWFFLTPVPLPQLTLENVDVLSEYAWRIRRALAAAGVTGAGGALIDHIELFADTPGADSAADARNFVLCPGRAWDRSPCGTGTSAKLATLAADGRLAPGQLWRQQSVLGSVFEASYALDASLPKGHIVPSIRGRAYITAESMLLFADDDPFAWGIGGARHLAKP